MTTHHEAPDSMGTCEVHAKNDTPNDRAKCGQCERDVGAIACCPERASGQCPFVERRTRFVFSSSILLIFVAFSLAITTSRLGIVLVCLVIALVLLAITREKLFYNTQSHVRLQRTTVAGVEWSYRWSWDVGLHRMHIVLTQPLTYPRSISSSTTW